MHTPTRQNIIQLIIEILELAGVYRLFFIGCPLFFVAPVNNFLPIYKSRHNRET